MGSIGRLGGALGGFLGVASNMGESGPLEFGDNAPFGENTPFPFAEWTPLVGSTPLVHSGICSLSWPSPLPLTASEPIPLGACGMLV